jgi:hypothetical protein
VISVTDDRVFRATRLSTVGVYSKLAVISPGLRRGGKVSDSTERQRVFSKTALTPAWALAGALGGLDFVPKEGARVASFFKRMGRGGGGGMCGALGSCAGGGGMCGALGSCAGGGGVCGALGSCAGGGGVCGALGSCAGGGGVCGALASCAGGGGVCGALGSCAGS